ncbi:MAG: hypothetical protein LBC87_07055 [Fibromonadaceae bacterium]|jgi:hypothetical protein|nr:hypothetical protein [Fibromonadaceae bacterium]
MQKFITFLNGTAEYETVNVTHSGGFKIYCEGRRLKVHFCGGGSFYFSEYFEKKKVVEEEIVKIMNQKMIDFLKSEEIILDLDSTFKGVLRAYSKREKK